MLPPTAVATTQPEAIKAWVDGGTDIVGNDNDDVGELVCEGGGERGERDGEAQAGPHGGGGSQRAAPQAQSGPPSPDCIAEIRKCRWLRVAPSGSPSPECPPQAQIA